MHMAIHEAGDDSVVSGIDDAGRRRGKRHHVRERTDSLELPILYCEGLRSGQAGIERGDFRTAND
jgi:hypothetical protein